MKAAIDRLSFSSDTIFTNFGRHPVDRNFELVDSQVDRTHRNSHSKTDRIHHCCKARVRKDNLFSQKSLFKCRAYFKSFKITPCIQSYLFSRNVSRIMEIYRTQIRDFLARRCEEISRSKNQKKLVT